MKLTPALRKEINQSVRRSVRGSHPGSRIGFRGAGLTALGVGNNALNWSDDDDLYDARPQATVKEIADFPENPGLAILDLYVDTGLGLYRELETNVYVFIRDGHVVGATANGFKATKMAEDLGFPPGRGWIGTSADWKKYA